MVSDFSSRAVSVEPEWLAVEREALRHECFAVENERTVVSACLRIGTQAELGFDLGRLSIKREVEVDRLYQIVWRSVVLEELWLPGGLVHRCATVLTAAL